MKISSKSFNTETFLGKSALLIKSDLLILSDICVMV
jgi:hypothetical protein